MSYLLAATLASLVRAQSIERYVVTSWAHRDGLPSTLIFAIAQTRDGYLWLGTSDGLVRFDGINFDHQQLVVNSELMLGAVTALHGAADGSLWIGSASGSLTQMSGARLRKFSLNTPIKAIVESSPGTVWVIADGGLYRFKSSEPGAFAPIEQVPSASLLELPDSRAGALVLGNSASLESGNRRRQFPAVYRRGLKVGGRSFLLNQASEGSVYLTGEPAQNGYIHSIYLRDRRGDSWTAEASELLQIGGSGAKPVIELTGREIESLFEDREGNVWAGTNNGLYLFRYGRVFSLTARDGLTDDRVTSVAANEAALWVGTQSGIDRIDGRGIRQFLPRMNILTVKAGRHSRIWAATHAGIFRVNDSGVVSAPELVVPQLSSVTAIEEDPAGCLWLFDSERGLYRWRDGLLLAVGGKPDFQAGSVSFLRTQRDGTLWIGSTETGLSIYRDDAFHRFSSSTGMATGTVYDAYLENLNLVWLATDTGLYRVSQNRSIRWNARDGLPGNRVLWLQPEDGQWLWLGFSTGIARVYEPDLLRSNGASPAGISPTVFDFEDGLLANPIRQSQAAATLDAQGKLWLTTSAGLAMIDSRRIEKNELPPNVFIGRVLADNRKIPLGSDLYFPPRTKNLEIDYNGLSLAAPRKLQFRYRLIGYDREWQEAGNRRQAFYTNLPPKTYRFQVLAANEDGVWSKTGASLGVTLQPAFQQTNTFKALCLAVAVLLAWGINRFRTQRLRAAWNARLETRLAERTRIAQELHDDLLQSAMGVSLQIELADSLVQDPPQAKAHLQRALTLSRALMQKGREVLRDLREETRETSDIAQVLAATIQEAQQGESASARLSVEGTVRPVHPMVAEDLAQIGCQAVVNAFQHARAKKIEVYLIYKTAELNLQVNDDGCGISPGVAKSGKPGHYGLLGMRERAHRIGGTLTIESSAGQGTRLTVSVPGGRAYRRSGQND